MRSEAETDGLEPILESRRASLHDPQSDIEAALEPPPPSLFSQLPLLVIIQYGLLALHTTSHDQVFLSYLVTYVSLCSIELSEVLKPLRQRLRCRRS
jgi:hypothetical protein